MANLVSCAHCGKQVSPELDNCPYCGSFMRRPGVAAQGSGKGSQTCPNCSALVQPGDIICVACGTNLLTGQRITSEQEAITPKRGINWQVVGIAAGVLVVIGIAVGGIYLMTRDPLERAAALAEDGRISEANQMLEEYVVDRPEDPSGHFALGKMQWRSRQYSEAALSFERTIELQPGNREAALMSVLARAEQRGGVARSDQIETLERYLEEAPNDAQAWFLLGLARGASGNTQGMIDALEEAEALRQEDPAKTLQFHAAAMALEGSYQEAERLIGEARNQAPGTADALATAGFINNLQSDWGMARELLTQALETGTSFVNEARIQLGLLHITEGRYEEAEALYRSVLETSEDNAAAQFFLGISLYAQQAYPEAQGEFELVSRGNSPFAAEAALLSAHLYLNRGEMESGEQALNRAEQKGASSPAFHTLRGRSLMRQGELNEAQEMFRKAIQADSSFAPAYLERGLLYIERGNLPEGIRGLQRYLEYADPELPGSNIEQVEALIGHLEMATGTFSEATEMAGTAARNIGQ